MRRLTITLSLALVLIAALVLAVAVAAKPIDPSPGPVGAGGPLPCTSTSTSATVIPGGVYRAMVNELREQGYSRAEIQAEIGNALVVPNLGARRTKAVERCIREP